MPLIKIELAEGRASSVLRQLMNTVMDSVADVLQLPKNDRNIRLNEYKKEFFETKPPYEIIIEITMFAGRSKEIKKQLFQTIVNNLFAINSINKENVYIILNEQPRENWGIRGGIPASEINFDFKINI